MKQTNKIHSDYSEKLKVLDLFSGIGGFSLGLERTGGFETLAFCEIDEHARKVLKKHWPKVPVFEDVKTLRGIEGEFDVICGGFPCQDISVAGKGLGLKGERSGLWKEYARLIKEIKPRYVIIENVANLRSKGLARVMQDLWEIGYDCEWHVISASSVGAFHKRERIWIIAYPNSAFLREQSGRRIGKSRQEKVQPGINGENGVVCDTSSLGCNGRFGEERHLQTNEEWNGKKIQSEGEQCEFVPRTNGEILSRRHIESIRATYSDFWESSTRVHRVVNGLSKGMERARKQRIKQLGNAVVPQIPELIGQAILEYEQRKHLYV